jgi:hypothetical protein
MLKDNNLLCELILQCINLNYLVTAALKMTSGSFAYFLIQSKLLLLYYSEVVDEHSINLNHRPLLIHLLTQ